ncbi:MAG TPA: XdhC family protein [Fastidiosipila sp.]|jgi:xanthine dehydrogenase accessory factor|nr:XdhC family protein [Fastidiosipila sp.]
MRKSHGEDKTLLDVFIALQKTLHSGKPVIFSSVAVSSGATPRAEGAHMAVADTGLLAGTIGGGAVEFRSIEKSKALLAEKVSGMHHYVLNKRDVEELGMICGGDVTVRFLYLSPEDEAILRAVDQAVQSLQDKQSVYLISGLRGEETVFAVYANGHIDGALADLSTESIISELADEKIRRVDLADGVVAELLNRAGRVVIFGGGHVGQALAAALVPLDFNVIVLDDREAFIDPLRFPPQVRTELVDLEDIKKTFEVGGDDFVCVMTRGHRFDQEVQAQVLKTDAPYIGVIGSRHKARTVFQNLKNDYGFSDQDLARIKTPIGLDIGAETPEEIAVSIAAELITFRVEWEKASS